MYWKNLLAEIQAQQSNKNTQIDNEPDIDPLVKEKHCQTTGKTLFYYRHLPVHAAIMHYMECQSSINFTQIAIIQIINSKKAEM